MRFEFLGVEFGTSAADDLIVTSFDRSSPDLRTDDVPRPRADGVMTGRDFLGGSTWTFELATNKRDLTGALSASAALERVWRSEARLVPGSVLPLRYQVDGRWRTVYGRPGRYSGPVGDVLAKAGAGRILMDFRVTDPLTYGDTLGTASLGIVPAVQGGLTAPLSAPLTTVASGAPVARFVTNSGDAPTPLTVKFYGPVTAPRITVNGQEVGLSGSLAYDESVTIDGRSQTVLRQDGISVAGRLTRATRLDYLRLSPGTHEVTFSGTDQTGTARVELSYRDASYSL